MPEDLQPNSLSQRIRLTVAYDGRPYQGWQSQPSGHTIQDHLERALEAVAGQRLRVHASGRTDSGVHALGQTIHFDAPSDSRLQPKNWLAALNSHLPRTIRIMDAERRGPDFHARFSAQAKTYRYRLYVGHVLPPQLAGMAWHLREMPELSTLLATSDLLLGRHDFSAFAANRSDGSDAAHGSGQNERTISSARWLIGDEGLFFDITGDGFLYRMVRLIVGALLRTAEGQMDVAEFGALLDQPRDRPLKKSPFCAPADGLTLLRVTY
ncbi:MAG: tRNA pseudouridine(38-40) synthase TruA [Verrucomicrobiota bacterium]